MASDSLCPGEVHKKHDLNTMEKNESRHFLLSSMMNEMTVEEFQSLISRCDLDLTLCNPDDQMSAIGYLLKHCRDTTGKVEPPSHFFGRFSHQNRKGTLYYIFEYVENKHLDWNNILGKQKNCLNIQNVHGNTLLHFACKYSRVTSVERLLQVKGCLQLKNSTGEVPLHVACREGNSHIVELLLKSGANAQNKNNSGYTPLLVASVSNHNTLLPILIKHGAKLDECDKNGTNALGIATISGGINTTLSLLEDHKMKIEDCFINGIPLLVALIQYISEDLITDPEKQDILAMFRPRFIEKEVGVSMFKSVIDHCEHHTKNWMDLVGGNPKFLHYQCNMGYTLFHYICRYERYEAATQLLKCGVNLQNASKDGNTALHLCSKYDYKDLVLMLVSTKGCDINYLNCIGFSPLSIACRFASMRAAEVLIKHGAKLTYNHKEGISHNDKSYREQFGDPLSLAHMACKWLPRILQLLLSYGLPVNDKIDNKYPLDDLLEFLQPQFLYRQVLAPKKINTPVKDMEMVQVQCMISAGAIASNVTSMISMEIFFRNTCGGNMLNFLFESGYQFHMDVEDFPVELQYAVKQPRSLKILSGQKIRTILLPNAWVSAFQLPIPKYLKEYVVMRFSGRNITFEYISSVNKKNE